MNVRTWAVGAALATYAGTAWSAPANFATGSNLTYGGGGNPSSLSSTSGNPATLSTALDTQKSRYGSTLFSLGVQTEVGKVGNIYDDYQTLEDDIEDLEDFFDDDKQSDLTLEDAEGIVDDANDLIGLIGDQGYVKTGVESSVPLLPLTFGPAFGGAWAFNAHVSATAKARVLDDPIGIDFNLEPVTDLAAYVKTVAVAEANLQYGAPVLQLSSGDLHVGGRFQMYEVGLGKTVYPAQPVLNGTDEGLDDATEDDLRNAEDDRQRAFDLDVGAIWQSDYYRLGATARNLLEPSFDYNTIGTNCSAEDSAAAEFSCLMAAKHSDRIALEETYTMNRQLRIEGAVHSLNRNWTLAGSYDVNKSYDPVADAYQWATVSGSYATQTWWIPDFRLGYRSNLVGTELDFYTAGFNLLGFRLDAAMARQQVELNGEESDDPDGTYPRALYVNLGFEMDW